MKISIIICTHNRCNLLLRTLDSIQNCPVNNKLKILILVAINACSDNTLQQLIDYKKQKINDPFELDFIEERRPGKSIALNKSLGLIKTDWICLIDDDHRLDTNYLSEIISAIERYPTASLFCGKILPDWTGLEPKWVHDKSQYKITPYPIPTFYLGDNEIELKSEMPVPGGGNLILHKKIMDRIGFFNESLGPSGHNLLGSEDTDFIMRALDSGEQIIYIPSIIQHHYVDPNNLKTAYLIKKSYYRNFSITKQMNKRRLLFAPRYLYMLAAKYLFLLLINISSATKRRFYITKVFGILGQINGYTQ